MPKKTRKQKQRSAARRQPPAIPGSAGIAEQPVPGAAPSVEVEDALITPAMPVVSTPVASAPATSSGRRRIERLDSPTVVAQATKPSRVPSNAASMFAPLPPDDAAIPFDRVPYVPADLRRVALMAVVMIVVIVIAAFVVSHIVT